MGLLGGESVIVVDVEVCEAFLLLSFSLYTEGSDGSDMRCVLAGTLLVMAR